MEQETQVVLSELIKVISRPDWWTIWITVVNAAIMVWLGWRQYKLQQQQTELQKRQTEAQEYEIYRRLYLLVNNANNEIDEFLNNLYMGTWQPHIQMDKDYLLRKQKYIEQLRKDLSENYWDYKLKFSQESFNADGYHRILSQMFYILQIHCFATRRNDKGISFVLFASLTCKLLTTSCYFDITFKH